MVSRPMSAEPSGPEVRPQFRSVARVFTPLAYHATGSCVVLEVNGFFSWFCLGVSAEKPYQLPVKPTHDEGSGRMYCCNIERETPFRCEDSFFECMAKAWLVSQPIQVFFERVQYQLKCPRRKSHCNGDLTGNVPAAPACAS